MDGRAMVAIVATVVLVVGIGAVVKYGQPWGGLLAGLGIAGWVGLIGTRVPTWELHDGADAHEPIELGDFLKENAEDLVHEA